MPSLIIVMEIPSSAEVTQKKARNFPPGAGKDFNCRIIAVENFSPGQEN